MGPAHERLAQIGELTKRLQEQYPEETTAFLSFLKGAEAGKALDRHMKELINVALSVAAQCEWCIAFHTKNAIAAGATRDELFEAGMMAVVMHGGPAYMYLVSLRQAYEEFKPHERTDSVTAE